MDTVDLQYIVIFSPATSSLVFLLFSLLRFLKEHNPQHTEICHIYQLIALWESHCWHKMILWHFSWIPRHKMILWPFSWIPINKTKCGTNYVIM